MNLSSLQTMNPSFFTNKPVEILTRTKSTVLPVSKLSLKKVLTALKGADWLSYKQLVTTTGLTVGTISRAAKHLCSDSITITKTKKGGKERSTYLKLIA